MELQESSFRSRCFGFFQAVDHTGGNGGDPLHFKATYAEVDTGFGVNFHAVAPCEWAGRDVQVERGHNCINTTDNGIQSIRSKDGIRGQLYVVLNLLIINVSDRTVSAINGVLNGPFFLAAGTKNKSKCHEYERFHGAKVAHPRA